jgi:hypothetical protein
MKKRRPDYVYCMLLAAIVFSLIAVSTCPPKKGFELIDGGWFYTYENN